jgi:PAS domain S-box-containing protein
VRVGGIGIFETDFQRNRTRFSPELCAILGVPEGTEMPYVQACLLFDQRDRDDVRAKVEAADNPIDQGRWTGVHRVVRVDGAVRWVSIHGRRDYRVTPLGRRVVRSLGSVIDISHLKETEESLRHSELRLRLALEATQMGTVEADTEGREASIDAQQARLLGLPEGTRVVSQDECRCRIPTEDLDTSDEKKRRLVEHNELYHHEFRIRMPDGSDRWLSAHATVRANRMFGVTRDITQRKRAEIALRESEARLRLAVGAAALGVFEWDMTSNRTVWENDRMYDIFGHTRDDGTLTWERFVRDYLHPDDIHAFETALQEALRSGGNLQLTCRIMQKGGSQRWVDINGRFEPQPQGSAMRLLGVVADITKRKDLEHQADEHSDQLNALQEEERRRIAQELHDSTVQHLVAASLNLMSLRANPEENETRWNEVEASMEEALRELRTFSYLMHPPALRAGGLTLALRQFVDGFASRAKLAMRLRLSSTVDSLPFRMQRSLLRIVQEALANVHRHASATKASIELRRLGGHVHLVITDNGHGLSEFDSETGAPLHPGVGIRGIKARVVQLGGDLRLRTAPSGTRLHAAIPLNADRRYRTRRKRSLIL